MAIEERHDDAAFLHAHDLSAGVAARQRRGLDAATLDRVRSSEDSVKPDDTQLERNAVKSQYFEIVMRSENDGGRIDIWARMRETEEPVVRQHVLAAGIAAAISSAENTSATITLPPMEIPGEDTCSMCILGDIEHGLWQL